MVTDQTKERFEEFSKVVRSRTKKGRWLILMHDNPDPDSIASAAALALILRQHFKRRVTLAYGGIIGRAENREMVRALGIRVSHTRNLNWKHYRYFALVDTQPGTGNNQLPATLFPEVVFDHHPIRQATRKVRFTDIRTDYGATATMLGEYLLASGIGLTKRIATGMVYAIRSETQEFGREYSGPDKAMYDQLIQLCDIRTLAKIQAPRLPLSYFGNLHEALENLASVSTLIVSHLGVVEQPDIVPEVADLLLRLEGKTWSLCTGIYEDRVYLSIRTSNPRADAGKLMRRLLGRRGKGGGHGMMAGGWVDIEAARAKSPRDLQNQLAKRLAKILKKNPDKLLPVQLQPTVVEAPPIEPTESKS